MNSHQEALKLQGLRHRYENHLCKELSPQGLEAIVQKPVELRKLSYLKRWPMQPVRGQRPRLLLQRYGNFLQGTILDVGCGPAYLRETLSSHYIGLDLSGRPDVRADLRHGLPFRDNAFDCVVANDVLEHLENIHEAFDELIRVTKKYVIMSLPNCWHRYWQHLLVGKSDRYGLPPEPIDDRHLWFFNTEEAEDFVFYRAALNNARVL
ncbi:MAG: class I SAM-dependent methyltransferase, partial [Dehalococcoidia bacterium]